MVNHGLLVETQTGEKGAVYNKKGLVNGKVPVYLEIKPNVYSDKAILCSYETLKIIGFID
jgi:hypothetical protein